MATAIVGRDAHESGAKILVRASEQDWHLELADRKFLFLKVQAFMTAALPEAVLGQTDHLLGMAQKDGLMPISTCARQTVRPRPNGAPSILMGAGLPG